jgi:hypothetical protein
MILNHRREDLGALTESGRAYIGVRYSKISLRCHKTKTDEFYIRLSSFILATSSFVCLHIKKLEYIGVLVRQQNML